MKLSVLYKCSIVSHRILKGIDTNVTFKYLQTTQGTVELNKHFLGSQQSSKDRLGQWPHNTDPHLCKGQQWKKGSGLPWLPEHTWRVAALKLCHCQLWQALYPSAERQHNLLVYLFNHKGNKKRCPIQCPFQSKQGHYCT